MRVQYMADKKRHRLDLTLTQEFEGRVSKDPGIMLDEWPWMMLEINLPYPEKVQEVFQAFMAQIRPIAVEYRREYRSRAERRSVTLKQVNKKEDNLSTGSHTR